MLIVVEQEEDNLTADIPGPCFRTFWNILIQIARNTNGRDYQEEEEHYIIINGTFARLAHGYKNGWLICTATPMSISAPDM